MGTVDLEDNGPFGHADARAGLADGVRFDFIADFVEVEVLTAGFVQKHAEI